MSVSLIKASNGNGEAVAASVTNLRTAGSTTIAVDSLLNWPDSFIATAGKELSDNTLDPASVIVFKGHKSGATIVIDSFAPGYTDGGSSVGDVVLIKPATAWADEIATTLSASLNDNGSLKSAPVTTALTGTTLPANTVNTAAVVDGAITAAKTSGIWWEEIGRGTLSGASTTVSFPARNYLKLLARITLTAPAASARMRVNSDSGANYAGAYNTNGTYTTEVSATYFSPYGAGSVNEASWDFEITNPAAAIKILNGIAILGNSTNAATAPTQRVITAKWVNTTNQITSVTLFPDTPGTILGEVVILGHN